LLGNGYSFLLLHEYPFALESFTSALAKDSKSVPALLGKGEALHQLGKKVQALQCYDQALLLEPDNTVALLGKGDAFLQNGLPDKALPLYEKVIEIVRKYLDPKESEKKLFGEVFTPMTFINDKMLKKLELFHLKKISK
jgi:tetratricopeptide (TPR) repeat protein